MNISHAFCKKTKFVTLFFLSPYTVAHPEEACPTSPSFPCNNLAPNGTLTLGASHLLNAGNVHIITVSCLLGKVALFRLWDTERSMEEVRSLYCIEGDVLKWEGDNWDTVNGAELPDSSLTCGEMKNIFYIQKK